MNMHEKLFEAIEILMELDEKELAFQLRVISDQKLRDWNQSRTKAAKVAYNGRKVREFDVTSK